MILIASSHLDKPTWQPVADILRAKGRKVFVYEADKVASADIEFTMRVGGKSGLRVSYDGHPLDWDKVSAAWFRRPNMFGPWQQDRLKQQSLDGERQALQAVLWSKIPDAKWLNAPSRISKAEPKLLQLELANSLGMTTPDTITTNRLTMLARYLPEQMVFKAARLGVIHDSGQTKFLYTTPTTAKELPPHANPYPGLWQPNITKRREWRITVVGSQCFDAAIYATGGASSDWRRPEFGRHVKLKPEQFPENIKKQCLAYLKKLGLRYGAFDFIENDQGDIVFLECNPNGQYGWLEIELGLPISEAIADQLIAIADARR